MPCHGCSDKPSRYGKGSPDLDRGKKNPFSPENSSMSTPPQSPSGNNNSTSMEDPFSTFFAARNMSYEELRARQDLEEKKMDLEAEEVMMYMTDAMRQMNIDRLINVVNSEKMGVPGMTADQGIVVLHKMLSREDFSFTNELYPGLKEAVEKRHTELVAHRLPGRKKK